MSSFYDDASLVVIPSGYKTSKVYAEKPTDGSGDLAFTRTGDTATRVNSAGLVEKVRTNLLTYSQDFSNAAWLIGSGQTKTVSQTDPNGGTTAVLISNVSEANGYLSQAITLTANVPNTFSIYIKGSSSGSVSIRLDDSGAGPQFDINYTTSWQRFSVTRTVNQSSCFLTVGGYSTWAIGENIQFAFAQVETSDVATAYIPTTTAAVSVGPVANVPRLDYLGSTCGKLLLEPQRTNLVTYSEQINTGFITAQGGTGLLPVITANNAISPDGYQNADTIVFNAGAGTTASDQSAIYQVFGGTTATYTCSFYAKTPSGTAQIQVRIDGGNYEKFTITNEWQRFTLTRALTGTSNALDFVIRRGLNEPMNASATIQLWGCQVELGAYATSYIPTLAASATRGADACSKTGISSLIGQQEGVIYWEGILPQVGDGGPSNSSNMLNSARNVNVNSAFSLQHINGTSSINALFFVGDGTFTPKISLAASSLPSGTYAKIAFAYKSGSSALYVNGTLRQSSSVTYTSSTTISEIWLNDLNVYYGYPATQSDAQILLFKTRLTNASLAELTTL